jgi:hypothetical protein
LFTKNTNKYPIEVILDKPKVPDSPPIKKAKVINNGGKNKEKRKDKGSDKVNNKCDTNF